MSGNPFGFEFKPVKLNPIGFGYGPAKKKRKTLTPAQRIYIWERPDIYGRTCGICHTRITNLSDLELDHKRAYSKGGKKLVLAHKDCNRLKSSGRLSQIQKTLGIKSRKKKSSKRQKTKRTTSRKTKGLWDFPQFRI